MSLAAAGPFFYRLEQCALTFEHVKNFGITVHDRVVTVAGFHLHDRTRMKQRGGFVALQLTHNAEVGHDARRIV